MGYLKGIPCLFSFIRETTSSIFSIERDSHKLFMLFAF